MPTNRLLAQLSSFSEGTVGDGRPNAVAVDHRGDDAAVDEVFGSCRVVFLGLKDGYALISVRMALDL